MKGWIINHLRNDNIRLCDFLFSFDDKEYVSIRVPYPPESLLSKIHHPSFINKCFYKTTFNVKHTDKHKIIHFGAIDHTCYVYVNNKFVGNHIGGYTPFEFDVTSLVHDGENALRIEVIDKIGDILSGKQSAKEHSFGCFYTRVTGIWQDVYLEYREPLYIHHYQIISDISNKCIYLKLEVPNPNLNVSIKIRYHHRLMGSYEGKAKQDISILVKKIYLWEIYHGRLYDIEIKYHHDLIKGYFAFREVKYSGYDFYLNNKRVYQKLVLNQGYYKDGVYTPKKINDIKKDVLRAKRLGFNGLRLHQKLFSPEMLYFCSKLGMMVWSEFPSWGLSYKNLTHFKEFKKEYLEGMRRDINEPCITTWCPFNETWETYRDVRFIDDMYKVIKQYDPTRIVVDVSGGYHGHKTDIYDFHCYEELDILKRYIDNLENHDILDIKLLYSKKDKLRYQKGLPTLLSECGGVAFNKIMGRSMSTINEEAISSEEAWGYAASFTKASDFINRYQKLIDILKTSKKISGFCYTQLYDVEQECNGFYTYDRKNKLSWLNRLKIKTINASIK